MKNTLNQDLALNEELQTSINLIKLGLGEYQNLDMANDFYYLPFQLISSGFERLMKCHICLGHLEVHKSYPDPKLFKNILKHDLLKIKKHILNNYYKTKNIPVLKADLEYLTNDKELHDIMELLSEFGKFARYYNLDVITGENNPSIDVKAMWEEFETSLLLQDKELIKNFNDYEKQKDVMDTIARTIIIKLERFVRAISRQFTLGDLGKLALQFSPAVYPFLMLMDDDLGTTDYRKNTTNYNEKEIKSHKRTLTDEIERKTNKNFVSKKITKNDFRGEWPFYKDEIIIECREKFWCIVSIDGYDYALNGAAKGRYKIEDVHEAGMAVLGKSIGPFINMALELGKKKK